MLLLSDQEVEEAAVVGLALTLPAPRDHGAEDATQHLAFRGREQSLPAAIGRDHRARADPGARHDRAESGGHSLHEGPAVRHPVNVDFYRLGQLVIPTRVDFAVFHEFEVACASRDQSGGGEHAQGDNEVLHGIRNM